MIESTMQDYPLTITHALRHGARVYPNSRVFTWTEHGPVERTFADIAANANRFAHALRKLGVADGTRVGTFMWNSQEHMEVYLAVPCMGAVMHTLNIRLFPEQLAYIVNHAENEVVVIDDSLIPLFSKIASELTTVKHYVVVGDGDASGLGHDVPVHRYYDLIADEPAEYPWPEIDERQAASLCYTSGTTGNPKGVAYSHRSQFLHSMAVMTPNGMGFSLRDRLLMIVPMFHANAWGIPYAAFLCGADLVMPGRFLQAEPLTRMVKELQVTRSGAVPTIWNDIWHYGEANEIDLSSLEVIVCGGAAVPRSLIENFERKYGVRILQGWGMTETSPLAAVALAPKEVELGTDEEFAYRARTGRVFAGVELRIVDDAGNALPWDDEAVGEIEVRGPWITGAYYRDPAPEKFDNGWLRTGDVGVVSPDGYIQITDRAKDVIKSGGEWISSVELENLLMAHDGVLEASVIGVPDPRWDERPLACIVRKPGTDVDAEALAAYLREHVAKWQVPERWAFIDEVPKTSVGKFDKKVLRARHSQGELAIESLGE